LTDQQATDFAERIYSDFSDGISIPHHTPFEHNGSTFTNDTANPSTTMHDTAKLEKFHLTSDHLSGVSGFPAPKDAWTSVYNPTGGEKSCLAGHELLMNAIVSGNLSSIDHPVYLTSLRDEVSYCPCMADVICSIGRMQASYTMDEHSALTTALRCLRECLQCIKATLTCGECKNRKANMALLISICDEIVTACKSMTEMYWQSNEQNFVDDEGLQNPVYLLDRSSTANTTSAQYHLPTPLQEYDANVSTEWDCLLGNLVFSQFTKVLDVIQHLKIKYSSEGMLEEINISNLLSTGQSLLALMEEIQRTYSFL
jgi:hypothetical protein